MTMLTKITINLLIILTIMELLSKQKIWMPTKPYLKRKKMKWQEVALGTARRESSQTTPTINTVLNRI